MLRFFLLSIFLFSCLPKDDYSTDNAEFVIDAKWEEEEYNHVPMSTFLEVENIIPLETSDEFAITSISQVEITDNFIFILDKAGLAKFNKKGELVNIIGARGNGPGEYRSLHSFDIEHSKSEIFLLDYIRKEIYRYDFNGNFLGKTIININDVEKITDFKRIRDGFLVIPMNHTISDIPFLIKINDNGDVINTYLHEEPTIWSLYKFHSISRVDSNEYSINPYLSDKVYTYKNGSISLKLIQNSLEGYNAEMLTQDLTRLYRNNLSIMDYSSFTYLGLHSKTYLESDNFIFLTYKYNRYRVNYLIINKCDNEIYKGLFKDDISGELIDVWFQDKFHYAGINRFYFAVFPDDEAMLTRLASVTDNPDLKNEILTKTLSDNPIIIEYQLKSTS